MLIKIDSSLTGFFFWVQHTQNIIYIQVYTTFVDLFLSVSLIWIKLFQSRIDKRLWKKKKQSTTTICLCLCVCLCVWNCLRINSPIKYMNFHFWIVSYKDYYWVLNFIIVCHCFQYWQRKFALMLTWIHYTHMPKYGQTILIRRKAIHKRFAS